MKKLTRNASGSRIVIPISVSPASQLFRLAARQTVRGFALVSHHAAGVVLAGHVTELQDRSHVIVHRWMLAFCCYEKNYHEKKNSDCMIQFIYLHYMF